MGVDERGLGAEDEVQAGQAAAEARLEIALQDLSNAMQEILDIVQDLPSQAQQEARAKVRQWLREVEQQLEAPS